MQHCQQSKGFVDSADPKHTSRLNEESDGVLRQTTWPPQSPDINPVKMVWDEMDCRVKTKGPTSAQHLNTGDYLMKLIERMPGVCKAVIKAKGGYFEESINIRHV